MAPDISGLQKSIISVGEVTDNGNTVVFQKGGGAIISNTTGKSLRGSTL